MRCLLVVFLAVALVGLSGCTLFGRKDTQSGWVVLDRAEAAQCAAWPLRDKDLAIDELMHVGGRQPGFLATGMTRDARPMEVFAPFDGGVQIDKGDIQTLELGRSAHLVGGASLGDVTVAGVGFNSKGKSSIELRNVKDNIVRFKGPLTAAELQSGTMKQTDGGPWLTYKIEDGDYGLMFLDFHNKSKVAGRLVGKADYRNPPVLVPLLNGGGVLAFTKDGDAAHPFRVRIVGEDGKASEPLTIDLAATDQIESWSATAYNGAYYLAVVEGDSLVGQSVLKVSALGINDGTPAVKWTREAPLKDVHVTEPVFVKTSKGLQVLLLKWVDEESTIARYIVAGGALGQPKFSGIFPKGALIVDAFTGVDGGDADDLFVIVRHKTETRWNFQICKL